jgi:hypothetical protein
VWAEIAAFVAGIAAGGRSEAGAAFVAGRRGIAADARESRRWAVGRRDARLGIMADWGRAGVGILGDGCLPGGGILGRVVRRVRAGAAGVRGERGQSTDES